MKSRRFARKWHSKTRVFGMLLLLLLVVFASVFFAFNLFTTQYIRSSVEMQLDDLTENFGRMGRPDIPQGEMWLPDISGQRPNRIGALGEVFVVDAQYEVMGMPGEDLGEPAQIADQLGRQNVALRDARYIRVDTSEGEYYISSIEDGHRPGSYFVFYVSVAGIHNLVDVINRAMVVIVVVAMLVCFLIANLIAGSVTKPLTTLSGFADDIGKGNFDRREFCFRDIEFDELGEAMNRSAEKLQRYDKDQRIFFQNVSHELRTPLQAIRSYAEGLEHGLMEPKKSGTTIVAETDRLSELVEDLLYISRVDSIGGHVEKSENDLRDTLALCAEALKPLADKHGIRFEFAFDDEPVLYTYNEKHMYRAFSNLVSNALRYAKTAVTLCCGQRDGRIEISVLDDGEGIAPDDLAHVFERFYKGRGGKHGIGLSIVKSVVELHGGEIAVRCDGGTCFTITFVS